MQTNLQTESTDTIVGAFKGVTTDIDRRHGDPDMGGLSSGTLLVVGLAVG